MAAIDRAIASPHSLASLVAGMLVDLGDTLDRFNRHGKWTSEGLRAVVLAYALHAPAGEFSRLVAQARKQLAWVEWWDTEGHDEANRVSA